VNADAKSCRPKRNLARGPIAVRPDAPRGSVAGAGSDSGAGSAGVSGAPLAAWRVATRICSANLPNLPSVAYRHRSPPSTLLPVYVPAIRQIRHSASRDAMHRSRYGTGDRGADATGRKVASGNCGTVIGADVDAPSGNCRHLATLNLALSAPLPHR
jgi:hypothetical protein